MEDAKITKFHAQANADAILTRAEGEASAIEYELGIQAVTYSQLMQQLNLTAEELINVIR